MPKPFHKLTLEEFADLINILPFRRQINAVHMDHTFRPNHAQFRKRNAIGFIESMWRFHTQERGFSDIAQYLSQC
jgi:hypothetical protein